MFYGGSVWGNLGDIEPAISMEGRIGMMKRIFCMILFVAVMGVLVVSPVSGVVKAADSIRSSGLADWDPNMVDCVGSDGKKYYHDKEYWRILYHSDGSTSYSYTDGGTVQKKLRIISSAGVLKTVYCIGAGLDYYYGGDRYVLEDIDSPNNYYECLPVAARQGISCVLMFGYEDGMTSPVEGTNADDYWIATQVLVWEYQQGLREGSSQRHANGKVRADVYYNMICNRPAEYCYNWIVEQIRGYLTFPSFVNDGAAVRSGTHTLVQEERNGTYRLELYDENHTGAQLTVYDAYGQTLDWLEISYLGGYRYALFADRPIDGGYTVTVRKQMGTDVKKILFFSDGNASSQVVACKSTEVGSPQEVRYMQVQTADYVGTGDLTIIKRATAGSVSGITFRICGQSDTNRLIQQLAETNSKGVIELTGLPAGLYEITEILPSDSDWKQPQTQRVTVEDQQISQVIFYNELKTGSLDIVKTFEGRETPLAGVSFEITGEYQGEIVYQNIVQTDDTGCIHLTELPVGQYTLKELQGTYSDFYILSDVVEIQVLADERSTVEIHNPAKRNRIQICKTGLCMTEIHEVYGVYTPVLEEQALSGAVFKIYAAEDICAEDGTVRILKDTLVDCVSETEGEYISEPLYPGKYRIEETTAPEGYVSNVRDTPIIVSVTPNESCVVEIHNARIQSRVVFTKLMEDGTASLYEQVSFGLYTKDEIKAPDGSCVPAGGLIAVATGKEDGLVVLDTMFDPGDFYIQELQTAQGYILDSEQYSVCFTENKDGICIGTLGEGNSVTNQKVPLNPTTGESGCSVVLFCLPIVAGCAVCRVAFSSKSRYNN